MISRIKLVSMCICPPLVIGTPVVVLHHSPAARAHVAHFMHHAANRLEGRAPSVAAPCLPVAGHTAPTEGGVVSGGTATPIPFIAPLSSNEGAIGFPTTPVGVTTESNGFVPSYGDFGGGGYISGGVGGGVLDVLPPPFVRPPAISPTSMVPEPNTWCLTIIGFAAIGLLMRYNTRRKVQIYNDWQHSR